MTQAAILAASGSPGTTTGFKNRIINGSMVIDQRNAGAEVNPAVSGSYYLDRWQAVSSVASKFKIGQNAGSVTPPVGFVNYLGVTSLSSYSSGAGDIFAVDQRIEGYNLADLNWGTANAKTITLSFWVYSSLTGTFGGSLRNSEASRSYPFTYTISSANTWEQKSITIAGDTTGAWLTTNGVGVTVYFSLGSGTTYQGTAGAWAAGNYLSATGATSVVGTSGATFYLTGVQLEVGTTATNFDFRSYGTELQLCQRYYIKYAMGTAINVNQPFLVGVVGSSTQANLCGTNFANPMRTYPTGSYGGGVRVYDGSTASNVTSIATQESSLTTASLYLVASGGGLTSGRPAMIIGSGGTTGYIDFSAEL